jgi:hypothetical protein
MMVMACGTDFYMNKKPFDQYLRIARGGKQLELTAVTAVEDNFFRSKFVSEFYRGNAEVIYENGDFKVRYENLPIEEEGMQKLENDIYAAYFAGEYPYSSTSKKFGDVTFENGKKIIYAKDGYKLYDVYYKDKTIRLYNNIEEYVIIIESTKGFRPMK